MPTVINAWKGSGSTELCFARVRSLPNTNPSNDNVYGDGTLHHSGCYGCHQYHKMTWRLFFLDSSYLAIDVEPLFLKFPPVRLRPDEQSNAGGGPLGCES